MRISFDVQNQQVEYTIRQLFHSLLIKVPDRGTEMHGNQIQEKKAKLNEANQELGIGMLFDGRF